jgi:Lrp/AsnC family leucine-responsive transcriptional regulator
MSKRSESYQVDSLDITILEKLLADGRMTFKELAVKTRTDQRTIANRFERMVRSGVIRKTTIDVDWSKLGLTASAFMGSTTALGEQDRKRLFDFIRTEPRVLESYATIGSHEYFLKVIDVDIATLRAEVCAPLEPLTADLTTSIVTNSIKHTDYAGLLGYLRKKVVK